MADPFGITPDVISAYTQKYGVPPTPAAISLFNEQNAAYSPGNPSAHGSLAGSGIPSANVPSTSTFLDNLEGIFGFGSGKGITDFFNSNPIGQGLDAVTAPLASVGNAASAVSSAIAFISDIPRVVTSVLGLVLIIAGIFALASGPAVQIVSRGIKEAATS